MRAKTKRETRKLLNQDAMKRRVKVYGKMLEKERK